MFYLIGAFLMYYGGSLVIAAPDIEKGSGWYALAGGILIILGWTVFGLGGGSEGAGGPAYG